MSIDLDSINVPIDVLVDSGSSACSRIDWKIGKSGPDVGPQVVAAVKCFCRLVLRISSPS